MENYHHFLKVFTVVSLIPMFVFTVSAVISAIYAGIKLRSPGISSEVRFVILRRHIITLAFFLITNLYFLNSMVAYLRFGYRDMQERNKEAMTNRIVYVFKILYQAQGLILPFIRLSEPYFFRIVYRESLGRLFGEPPKAEEKELAPLFSFLKSSLNVELVYIILKGITGFSYISRGEDCDTSMVKKVTLLDPDAENATIQLNKIKIKDAKRWESSRKSIQSNDNEE